MEFTNAEKIVFFKSRGIVREEFKGFGPSLRLKSLFKKMRTLLERSYHWPRGSNAGAYSLGGCLWVMI